MAARPGRDPGEVRWNPETQSWDEGPRAAFTPPPPPPPQYAPRTEEVTRQLSPNSGELADTQVTLGPPPPPEPQPWYRRRTLIVGLVLALAMAGGGLGGWYLTRDDGGEKPQANPKDNRSGAPSSPAVPGPADPSGSPSYSVSPSPSPNSPPPGYVAVSEREFTLHIPEGWQRRTEKGEKGVTLYFYEEEDEGARRIQVFKVTEPDPTPRGTLELAESLMHVDGYHRNSLKDVSDKRGPAAELDYSYDSGSWGRMRTLDRVVHGKGEELYAVLSIGPEDDWPAQQEVQQAVLDGLCFEKSC